MTAKTVIQGAYRLLGNLRHGQTAGADALTDGLSMLNDMLDAWAIERMTIPVITRRVLDITASQSVYTIGSGGNWNVARPVRIDRASVVTNSVETPLEILTDQRYAEWPNKSETSTVPEALYFNNAYPLASVTLLPVPTDSTSDIVLYVWTPFTAFADLDTTNYDFPPGAALALRYCLAELLIPESIIQNKALPFGGPQYGHIIEQARILKGRFKAFNAPMPEMGFDRALTSGYWDMQTGVYR